MIRRLTSFTACAILLSSCGGGGGSTTPAAPVPGMPHQNASATLKFKLPGKTLLAHLRRPLYVSQGTQGIAIDWASTDPTHPDFSVAVSATCPSPLPSGVTACSIDAQGNTDYTFQLALAPGNSYTFTVAAFDQPPSSGTFSGASTHMLAEGSLTTPVAIVAGQPNVIPSITFYGVPASVSLAPGPADPHVIVDNPGWGVIGNAPQTFYAQAQDAQGYAIAASDAGAPTITVAESATDPTQYFTIASISSNTFTFTAKSVPAANAAAADIIVAAAANGGVQGTATANVPVMPIEELWTTQTSGGSPSDYGIAGYALLPPNYGPPGYFITPLDLTYDDPALNLCGSGLACQFQQAAFSGNIAVAKSAVTLKLYEFTFSNATGTYTMPTQPLPFLTSGGSIANVALDAAGHLFIVDNTSGTLDALNAPTDTAYTYERPGLSGAAGLAVAPSTSTIPASLQQTIWAGDGSGGLHLFSSFANGMVTLPTPTISGTAPTSQISAIGFDASGNLWLDASGNIYAYSINAATTPITLTFLATYNNSLLGASNFGASLSSGSMWFGSLGALYSNESKLTLSGCPGACAISASTLTWPAPGDASYVVP